MATCELLCNDSPAVVKANKESDGESERDEEYNNNGTEVVIRFRKN